MSTPVLYVRNQIIARAMRLAQIASDMEVMSDQKMLHAGEAFACLLRTWQERNIALWAEEWLQFNLTASSTVINSLVSYRCIKGHTSIPANEPGVGANWTTYWVIDTTVATTAWAVTTAYTCIAEISATASHDIVSAFLRDETTEYNLVVVDQVRFFKDQNIQVTQTPDELWFDKKNYLIHLTPIPEKTTYVLHALSIRILDNILTDGQRPDIPSSYQDALVYELAANLADENGLPLERCNYLRANGRRIFEEMQSSPCKDQMTPRFVKSMFSRSRP